MTETIIPIPARLRSSVVGGHVTGAVDVYDDDKNKNQAEINAEVDAAIAAEETRAKAAEQANADAIAAEVTRATGAESTLTTNLAAEVTRATGAEGTITSNLSTEVTRAQGAESTLQGNIDAEVTRATTAEGLLDGRLDNVEALIPSEATSTNQLADKSFVNSSVATATANFKGTFNSLAELEAVTDADNNDYGFVVGTDAAGNTVYNRYKYNGTSWVFEYALNNSSFTAEQWDAINSAMTLALKNKLSALPTNDELTTLLAGKQAVISDLDTIRSGASAGATAYQKPSTGIPSSDMSSAVQGSLSAADTAYQKPSTGIPATDLTSAAQTSLGKADTALQPAALDDYYDKDATDGLLNGKQATLVSGTNIKTINSQSILGSGNIVIEEGGSYTEGNGISISNDEISVKAGSNLSFDAEGNLNATDTTYDVMGGSGASHASGLVPDPGTTAGTTKFLREDGSWQTPPGQNYTAGDGLGLSNGEFSVDSSVARLAEGESGVLLPEFVPGIFTGTCSTAAATQAKEVEITGYELIRHNGVAVTFTNGISVASATLNISSLGAKPLYYKGAALAADVILAGDIATMTYNGTQFEIFSIERKPVYSQIGSTNYYSMTI